MRTNPKRRELRDALDGSGHIAHQRYPREPGKTGDAAEGQHEAVCNGGDEQGFGRPSVARSAELCWRRRRDRRKTLALQGDISLRVCLRDHRIVMWKWLHECLL